MNETLKKAINEIRNPYSEDIFTTTLKDAGKYLRGKIGDNNTSAISGAIMRYAYNLAIEDVKRIINDFEEDEMLATNTLSGKEGE